MPTVNHVRRSNIPLETSSANSFRAFWELTRAMKKAGWKYKASSDGTAKETTGNPALDKWNSATSFNPTNAGGALASIAAPTRGRATVTGLTGIVATDKGRFLTISGAATGANNNQHQIEEILSSTSVRIDARQFAVASDANNGSLTWSISDPMSELFSGFATPNAIGWWVAQGPSTLKIPITAASTGTFRRGENITQATTGAEGELVGYTFYNGSGWLVVAPRLRGTGSGAFGWDTGNTITGAKSGATVSQNGTAIDYVWEVEFIKPANQTAIQIFVIQADKSAESAELFSTLAASAGATATVHPGGGGTGNAFPTHAWVAYGTTTTAGAGLPINANASNPGIAAQILCVDAIPEEDYSADGSWSLPVFVHNTATTQPPGNIFYGFHRLVDTEDGEVSLYASVMPAGLKTNGANNRTSGGTAASQLDNCAFLSHDTVNPTAGANGTFAGWRARGLAGENFAELNAASLVLLQQQQFAQIGSTSGYLIAQRMLASAHPCVKPREKIWMSYAASRGYKGSFRWLFWVHGGLICDVFGNDPGWLQLSCGSGANSGSGWAFNGGAFGGGAMIVGPHDGLPVSIQALGG